MNDEQMLDVLFVVVCFVMGTLLMIPQFLNNPPLEFIQRCIGLGAIVALYIGVVAGVTRFSKDGKVKAE